MPFSVYVCPAFIHEVIDLSRDKSRSEDNRRGRPQWSRMTLTGCDEPQGANKYRNGRTSLGMLTRISQYNTILAWGFCN